jgi:hypothetical protein
LPQVILRDDSVGPLRSLAEFDTLEAAEVEG